MRTFVFTFLAAFTIYFGSWLLIYKLGTNDLGIQSEDTVPALFLPFAILTKHTLYLDDYYSQMVSKYPQPDDKNQTRGYTPFYLKKVGNHFLSAFPIVTPIISLPVFVAAIELGATYTWENLILLSHICASIIMAISGSVFYLVLTKRFKMAQSKALLLWVTYCFGTVNFALLSQAMWQHGTLVLFTVTGLYYLYGYLENDKDKISLWLAGICFAIGTLARPTGVLSLILAEMLVLYYNKTAARRVVSTLVFFVGTVICLAFFYWYNQVFYVDIHNQGYASQIQTSWLGDFPLSFFGVWLSPSKGILIYSPVLIFMVLGWVYINKLTKYKMDFLLFMILVLIHTLVISFWKHWYGGWSFGYRMSSEVIPYMVLGVVPFVNSVKFDIYKRTYITLLVVSVAVQFLGLVFFDGVWHAAYDRGFKNTSWLWSIKDSEFVFYVRRILVKFGWLYKACEKC